LGKEKDQGWWTTGSNIWTFASPDSTRAEVWCIRLNIFAACCSSNVSALEIGVEFGASHPATCVLSARRAMPLFVVAQNPPHRRCFAPSREKSCS
jgi:hypothetical protein